MLWSVLGRTCQRAAWVRTFSRPLDEDRGVMELATYCNGACRTRSEPPNHESLSGRGALYTETVLVAG